MSPVSRFVGLLLLACAALAPVGAQNAPNRNATPLDAAVADSFARAARARAKPAFAATVLTSVPVIDGKLDDAAWTAVSPITDFIQRELNEGVPASERTEVRIASDGQYLYVAARMFDREPQLIVPG
ncbi:MAG: hypothetical protein MUE41_09945, partial [Gemmatimonadaceae bacterium]|nr:hypothetical protein [Gemmatimonadaceae bacterium]